MAMTTIRNGAAAWLLEMETILAAHPMETATGDGLAVIAAIYREMYKLRSILVPATDSVFRARITAWMTEANGAFVAVPIRPDTAHILAAIYRGMFQLRGALAAPAVAGPTPSPSPVPASSPAPPAVARAAPPPAVARAATASAATPPPPAAALLRVAAAITKADTDRASRQLKAQKISLRTFGYAMDGSATRRQTAIRLAIRQHGAKMVQARLDLLAELWADSRKPAYLAVLKDDRAYVQQYAAATGVAENSD